MDKLITLFFIETQRFKQTKKPYINITLANFNGKDKNGNPNNNKVYLYGIKHRFSLEKCWTVCKALKIKVSIKRKNIDKKRIKAVQETFEKRQYTKLKTKLFVYDAINGINNEAI